MPLPDLKPHPLSQLTPAMPGEQFQRLLEDVVINGVRTPILLFEGMILDGVNRYRAAKSAGRFEIPTEVFEGTRAEAIRRVMSLNAHRRHMNSTQRALLAARVIREIRSDEAVLEDRLTPDALDAARKLIERPDRDDHVIWPPREGFPAGAPEELRAFARDHGVENVALAPIGDDAEFDNAAARAEIETLVADGMLDPADVPKDETDPAGPVERFSADRRPEEVSGHRCPKPKNKGGRPRNVKVDAIAAEVEVSRRTAKRAVKIDRDGSDELKQALADGAISVRRAAEIVKLPKSEQAEAISSSSSAGAGHSIPKLLRTMSELSDSPATEVKKIGREKAFLLLDAARRLVAALEAELEKPQ